MIELNKADETMLSIIADFQKQIASVFRIPVDRIFGRTVPEHREDLEIYYKYIEKQQKLAAGKILAFNGRIEIRFYRIYKSIRRPRSARREK